MKKWIGLVAVGLASVVSADVLFSSNFDGNNVAIDSSYVKDETGAATASVTWQTDSSVSAISDLAAITGGGGFVNQGTELSNGDTLKLNYNLNKGSDEGFSMSFTISEAVTLDDLTVTAAHLNGTGTGQSYSSDLTFSLSGGTLLADVTDTKSVTYAQTWLDVVFDVDGTTLGAGTYTLGVSMANLNEGGAYGAFDGVSLSVVPEPATFGLLGAGVVLLAFCRRRLAH